MKCVKCGLELDRSMVRADGALECPGCGAVYRRKSAGAGGTDGTAGNRQGAGQNVRAQYPGAAGRRILSDEAATRLRTAADRAGQAARSAGDAVSDLRLGEKLDQAAKAAGRAAADLNLPEKLDRASSAAGKAAEAAVSYGRKKRILPALLLAALLLLGLGAGIFLLAKRPSQKAQSGANAPVSSGVGASASSGKKEASSGKKTSVPSGVEWTEVTYTTTDEDGYTFEITYRISPWILLSNTDVVNAVWAEISGGDPLPGFDDWGLERYNNGYWRPNNISDHSLSGYKGYMYCEGMNDMYYCMGTLSVKNRTEGWSFSEENKRSCDTRLWWRYDKTDGMEGAQAIGHLYLSSKVREEADGVLVYASMVSDDWGPCPFVIMSPEAFTPNYPDGRFYEHLSAGAFSAGDQTGVFGKDYQSKNGIRVGIIGRDGVFRGPYDNIYLTGTGRNAYSVSSSASGDKCLVWDAEETNFFDEETRCWVWHNTTVDPDVWQYWYEGISSDYGDYGWMEHDADGWYIEESNGHWIKLPESYDTSRLWYIE